MRRRTFLSGLATSAALAGATTLESTEASAATGQLSELELDSTSSLLDSNYDRLTDSSVIVAWAADTATNVDSDGDGYGTLYDDATSIPVVGADSGVVGFGAMLVDDGTNWQRGNEEFVLNVWDASIGGGTVLWDESHGQYYGLSKFSSFRAYAENNGYDVRATSSLSADLSSADAVVITSPGSSFATSELRDLSDFVSNGGTLLLHDQSDYDDLDETANLNDITGYLGLSFRFNDDEVLDEIRNGGADYEPTTDAFNTSFDYFADRPGLGLDPTATYTSPVNEVLDGNTIHVTIDGTVESVRLLGMDTPEKQSNSQAERVQEWEGIDDLTHLQTWGANATDYGKSELSGKTVDVTFDAEEPVRDVYGRLLGYVHYDATGDGTRDDLYNYNAVASGHARVYDSGLTRHHHFLDAENAARANGTGLWGGSDPSSTSPIRNRAVDDLFVPKPASVTTTAGSVDGSRVPVWTESTATRNSGSAGSQIPLVAVDEAARVGVIGGELVDEHYEQAEGYPVDTSTFENYVFVTNLIDLLSNRTGDVLVDGGHGQFGATFGLSAEDVAYYLRYLEGQGIGLQGVNDITTEHLSGARALVVTTPPEAYSRAELDALDSFVADGGAVVLMGSGWTTAAARDNLNAVAASLGTDLRIAADRVTDATNNLDNNEGIPTTTNFDTSFDLFSAYDPSGSGSGSGELSVAQIHEDATGNDNNNLNDEYVVFENIGDGSLDLTDWQVTDEVDHAYTFPSFTLDAGAQVTLHTGSGTDTGTDLYWNRGSAIWNNGGDTVSVYDDTGSLVLQDSY